MIYTSERVLQLIDGIPWGSNERVRLFWVRLSEESREKFAGELARNSEHGAIVPVVIRETLFLSANSLLSDVGKLIESSRNKFDAVQRSTEGKLTIVILSKEEFRLPQVSSPIILPRWFPFLGGMETYLRISDLGQQAEVALLNCPESRVEQISELLFSLEAAVVQRIKKMGVDKSGQLQPLLSMLYGEKEERPPTAVSIAGFVGHLDSVQDARAYRATAKAGASLVSRLLRIVQRSSPDDLGGVAKKLAGALDPSISAFLKPPIFAVMLRPSNQVDAAVRNWHAILLAIYQAYQLTTAAAHAGDYASFPVALISSTSRDLARFLRDAARYVESFND
ncbi:MAG: hypothetical protein V4505_23765 [Pseudomonadota bacterium]